MPCNGYSVLHDMIPIKINDNENNNRTAYIVLLSDDNNLDYYLSESSYQKKNYSSQSDCNWTRTHNYLVRKSTLPFSQTSQMFEPC